ncbi:MAG: pitrilysin family protein [Fulvivirga sp.]
MRDYEIKTLSNGIRVIHKEVTNTKVAHCGFMLDIGSRDESEDYQGIAHFWEHMAFKGTRKRKAFHILNRIDAVGGELNAYTTKEKIAFYASVIDSYFEKAVDLLKDITFDSIFPEKQIDKERKVILEEMAMYYDAPEDAIQDDFDAVIFPNHALGRNILGTADSVRAFHRDDFRTFIKENINTEKIVFCSVGNMSFKKVLKIVEKHLNDIPHLGGEVNRTPFPGYKKADKVVKRALTQSHCAIGRDAYSLTSDKKLPFFMLTNILGGPGMNSRLNLALREKHGFVYSIDAGYQSYTDTGLFGIFFATEHKQLARSIRLVKAEMRRLKDKPLGAVQLKTAKEQLMGQLAMAEENNVSLMLMMGKSILDINKIESLDSIFERIKKTTAAELQDIANEMFDENQLSQLTFLPK